MFNFITQQTKRRRVAQLRNQLADLRALQDNPECSHKEFHRAKERAEQGHYAKEMFDEAQAIARKTLLEDIFPRFEESEAGKALATRPDLCE